MTNAVARMGLTLALCALPLGGCGDRNAEAPGTATTGEARALADAEAMLDERTPAAPDATAPTRAD